MTHRERFDYDYTCKVRKQRILLRIVLVGLAFVSLATLTIAQNMTVTMVYAETATFNTAETDAVAIAKCPRNNGDDDYTYTQLSPMLYKTPHGTLARYWVEPTIPSC